MNSLLRYYFVLTLCCCLPSMEIFSQHQPVHIPPTNIFPSGFLNHDAPIARLTHRIWKTEHGLPQNSATALCQTSDGYLWIGTEEGLVRFDGVRFTTFNKTNTPAFKNHWVNEIIKIKNSNDGGYTLWVGTLGGLIRLQNGVFTSFTTKDGLPSNSIVSLLEDRIHGGLWIGTRGGGLSCFRNNAFTNYTTRNGLAGDFVHGLAQGRDGTVWIGLDGGGVQSFRNGVFNRFTVSTHKLTSDNVWAVLTDTTDKTGDIVWIGTNGGGLNRLQNGVVTTSYTAKEGLTNNIVAALWREANGTLWVGTWGGGLNRLQNGTVSRFTTKEGLSDNVVFALHGDREGTLWAGTQGGGVNQFRTGTFTTYTALDGLVGNFAVCFSQSEKLINPRLEDSVLWMGTYNGLSKFSKGTFTNYTVQNGLTSNNVHTLWQDSSDGVHGGALWIGTWDGGLNRLLNGVFTHFGTKDGLLNNTVTSVKPDESSRSGLWVGTWGGVNRLQDGTIRESYTVKSGLTSNFVLTLLHDRVTNSLWIGTWGGGLNRLQNGVITAFTDTNGLSNNFVRSLMQDREGVLWVGTAGGGLHRYKSNSKGAQWTNYTSHDGLFDDHIWTIREDGMGWVWMTCNRGVFRVQKSDLTAFAEGKRTRIISQAFGRADGMKDAECNGGTPSSWQDRTGRLYFPTAQGVASVQPSRLVSNPLAPPVIIEHILADSLQLSVDAPLTFSPDTKKFEFAYTATSLAVPEKVQFRYLLEGYDKDWTSVGTRRVAYYTNLPRGRAYRFRVVACNNDGVWNESGAAVEFVLKPFFWETWWFLGICTLGVGMAGFGAYGLRVRRLRGQAKRLENIIGERTSELREANDEIQHQLVIQTEQAREIELANTYLQESNAQLDRALRDLQETQTQLVASERIGAIGMLAAGIMHEINNPNAGVYGALEQISLKIMNLHRFFLTLLDDESKKSPEALRFNDLVGDIEKMLDLARNGSTRVKNIVGTLRGFTKHQAEGIKVDTLERELTSTVEIFRFQYNAVRVSLEFTGDCTIEANFGEINQVFLNLLINAAQAGATEISICSTEVPAATEYEIPSVEVRMKDNGRGMDNDLLVRIFEPFYTTKGAANSGLGLTISKKILERHKASMRVESELGMGTTFLLRFVRRLL